MSNHHITYSDRYQNFVIIDDRGRQVFRDGRPLVFTERELAEDYLSA